MGETSQPSSSRVRLRNNAAAAGEIVKVQGGHIVRSTGRKDRHSKVCTAKGPRDRRVRLAAHTAIQFYDVQDRLGYDRPSKAVDWLINKAKSAIDELEQLPPWHPTATCNSVPNPGFEQGEADLGISSISEPSSKRAMTMAGPNNSPQPSSFLPPSLDSDAIADTIKSFFPMGASAEANSSAAMQFHNFPIPDLPSRNSANTQQDLRLSLQSFQDPNSLHHHHHHHSDQTHSQTHIQSQVLLSGIPLGFDGTTAGWAEQQHHQAAELGRFQRHPPQAGRSSSTTRRQSSAASRGTHHGTAAAEETLLVGVAAGTCSTRRRNRRCSSSWAKTSFFHRGDPFSPVTHLQFVLGWTHPP